MNQPFKIFFQFDERAEVHDAGNFPGHHIAQIVFIRYFFMMFNVLDFLGQNQFSLFRVSVNNANRQLFAHQLF